jgi:Fe-S oxidoreductase
MGSTWKLLNVGAFIALGGHLGSLAVTSISSGHPDSLTCYECRACASPCPWKLDPSGYLVAARVNNPDRRMLAQYNVRRYNRFIGNRQEGETGKKEDSKRMTLDNLEERDEFMKVIIGKVTSKENIDLFTMPSLTYLPFMVEGVVNEDLRDAFEENRWAISSGATITEIDSTHWQIYDEPEVFHLESLNTELSVAGEKKEFDKSDPMQIKDAKEELDKYENEDKEAEFTDIYEMRAKDSAFYDPLCARCEPACPVALRITKFIRDVKADGKYR